MSRKFEVVGLIIFILINLCKRPQGVTNLLSEKKSPRLFKQSLDLNLDDKC